MKKIAVCCLLAGLSLLLLQCTKKKSVSCDSATVCMLNNTTDTLRYCWGCNQYTDKVAPGETACRTVLGPIDNSSTKWVDFQTASGTRRIEVADCNVQVSYR